MAHPQIGTYTRGTVTRIASTPSEAVRLHADGWTRTPGQDPAPEPEAPAAPKPSKPAKPTEN